MLKVAQAAMDLVALCDIASYVELKTAPINAIWLFSVLTECLPTILWLSPHPPFILSEVLVVLATAVKTI